MQTLPFVLWGDLLGKPWIRMARGPDAYDCYGLVLEIYRRMGVQIDDLPYSEDLRTKGRTITDTISSQWVASPLRAGAVLVFADCGIPTHMGVAIDATRFIHASGNHKTVLVTSLETRPLFWSRIMIGTYERKAAQNV